MAWKDDYGPITILAMDGDGFTVTVIFFKKNEDGTFVTEPDENGVEQKVQDSDVYAFTNFTDMGAFIIGLND